MNRYCALVVLYNPDIKTFDNILSYIDSVEKVFVIDNSSENNSSKLFKVVSEKKADYYPFGGNKGLAYALNYGCQKAISEGFNFCLTMDQDSIFEKGAAKKLIKFMDKTTPEYAAVCPNFKAMIKKTDGSEEISFIRQPPSENILCNWTMTSGTLMSLKAYSMIGGFDNDLFIGHIDVELGVKLNKYGEKIIIIGDAILRQYFGNATKKRFLWKEFNLYNGRPVRTYYTWRNELIFRKKYGKNYKKFANVKLGKDLLKTILYEKQKKDKILMMIQAVRDAASMKMGQYDNTNAKCNNF